MAYGVVCGHKVCSLPEVSITSFLPLQFFVYVRLSESKHRINFKFVPILNYVPRYNNVRSEARILNPGTSWNE